MTGGEAFFDRAEVGGLLAYLRLVANPDDDAAFLRAIVAPKREVGATTLEKLGELAGRGHTSLLRAASSASVIAQLSARPGNALNGFVELVEHLRRIALEPRGRPGRRAVAETQYDSTEAGRPTRRCRAAMKMRRARAWLSRRGKSSDEGRARAQIALLCNADRDDSGKPCAL